MKYPKRSQYKHAKSQYRLRNWCDYEAGSFLEDMWIGCVNDQRLGRTARTDQDCAQHEHSSYMVTSFD